MKKNMTKKRETIANQEDCICEEEFKTVSVVGLGFSVNAYSPVLYSSLNSYASFHICVHYLSLADDRDDVMPYLGKQLFAKKYQSHQY